MNLNKKKLLIKDFFYRITLLRDKEKKKGVVWWSTVHLEVPDFSAENEAMNSLLWASQRYT